MSPQTGVSQGQTLYLPPLTKAGNAQCLRLSNEAAPPSASSGKASGHLACSPVPALSSAFHFMLLVERVGRSLTGAQFVVFLLESEGGRAQGEWRAWPPC